MVIVTATSPLWKLPQGLHPLQGGFFDAIRLSVQFIDVAHARLYEALTQLTLTSDRSLQIGPNALMDAWAIIDAVHRLRSLVRQLPRYKQRAPSKRLFMDKSQSVEQLRNSFQHLVSDLSGLTDSDLPVLGALTWVRPVDHERNRLSVSTFIPGQLKSIAPSSWVTVPSIVPDGVTQIELWHGDKSVSITMLHRAVSELVTALEGELAKFASDKAPAICDAMASVTLELVPEPSGPKAG